MNKIKLLSNKLLWKKIILPILVYLFFINLAYPKYDKKTCYYQEFWKVYLLNEIMISKIKDYSVTNKQISTEIQTLEDAEK